MNNNNLFSRSSALSFVISLLLILAGSQQLRAQVVVQNFDNAVGTFFPDPPTTNQDFFASNPAAVFDLSNYSTDSYEGSGSMKIDYNVGHDTWGGWIVRTTYDVSASTTSLPYIDLSSGEFLSLWYKVLTPASLTESGIINFEFKLAEYNDPNNRELWQHVTSINLSDNSGSWLNVTIPLRKDADPTVGFALQLGYIDGELQLDKIKGFEIAISYQTTGSPSSIPIASGSILLDNLQLYPPSYDIYAVNAKTGNAERVTFLDNADEYNPTFAPGGLYIAHDVKGGSAPLGHSIYTTNLSTGVSTFLTGADGGNDASWSPDSMYIAFDRTPVGDFSIYTVPATGGTRTLIRSNAVDAEWSNNSKRLVFQDITDGSIRTVDLSGGTETTVVSSGANPSWSNNGKYIAYTAGNNIYRIKVSESGKPTGSPVQLTNDGSGIFNQQPSWSNNSKTIVFHSNRESGDLDIWTVSAFGGTPALLTGDPDYGDYDPCYSKNGKYVAYSGFTNANLSTVPLALVTTGTGEEASNTESAAQIPETFSLEQNYPNPFNPTTTIRFALPQANRVTLRIYNSVGQLVRTLLSENRDEGYYNVVWDTRNDNGQQVSAGVYLYRITAGNYINTKKMILMK